MTRANIWASAVDGENVLSPPPGILSLSNQIGILKKVCKNES